MHFDLVYFLFLFLKTNLGGHYELENVAPDQVQEAATRPQTICAQKPQAPTEEAPPARANSDFCCLRLPRAASHLPACSPAPPFCPEPATSQRR